MIFHRFFLFLSMAVMVDIIAACEIPPRSTPHTVVRAPQPVAPAAPIPKPAAPATPTPATNAYFNSQYHFTCTIPDGFIVTHESDGPGEIMTLVPQSMSSNSTINLSMRAAPLGKLTLQQYMDFRITKDLQGTPNVTHWDMFPATYGSYTGFEVLVERQYASGPFKTRLFGFSHGTNVFIVNYSASADQFDLDQKALESFLESLTFTP